MPPTKPSPHLFRISLAPQGQAAGLHTLPPDLLAQAAGRVRIAGYAIGAIWLIFLILMNPLSRLLEGNRMMGRGWPMPGNLIAAIGLGLSLLMAWWVPRLKDGHLALRVGLGYQVVTCALLALIAQWSPDPDPRGVAVVSLVILVYPSIAPASWRATLAAALLSALTEPAAFGLAMYRGVAPDYSAMQYVIAFIPEFVAAGLALVPARVIRSLGQKVSEAREVGNYRLENLLGKGGMGEVYRATHRLIARPAAVKLISPEILGQADRNTADRAVERFRREATAVAALRSPHTVELYDYGVANNGSMFYVMELLDGVDLQRMVDLSGPLPTARVIHFLRQACNSLGEAHQMGLVHRDIKPSNLFACRLGLSLDVIKVLDFGLVSELRPTVSSVTMADVPVGTPAFMAPEQLGGGGPMDARTDLYGLGSVAFWMLTGRLVFEAAALHTLLALLVTRPAPSPSAVRGEAIPAELEALVLRCLAKEPADRPGSAEEMLEVLEPLAVAHPWTAADAAGWWEKHQPAAGKVPAAG